MQEITMFGRFCRTPISSELFESTWVMCGNIMLQSVPSATHSHHQMTAFQQLQNISGSQICQLYHSKEMLQKGSMQKGVHQRVIYI